MIFEAISWIVLLRAPMRAGWPRKREDDQGDASVRNAGAADPLFRGKPDAGWRDGEELPIRARLMDFGSDVQLFGDVPWNQGPAWLKE